MKHHIEQLWQNLKKFNTKETLSLAVSALVLGFLGFNGTMSESGTWGGRTAIDIPEELLNVPDGVGSVERMDNCDIKGNVSRAKKTALGWERIYHVRGGRYYGLTKIEPERGERWFCTTAEAEAGGWRAARR